MEGAHSAYAFSTGMAALAAMCRILKAGDEILCNADIYGGMYRLLTKVVARQGKGAAHINACMNARYFFPKSVFVPKCSFTMRSHTCEYSAIAHLKQGSLSV